MSRVNAAVRGGDVRLFVLPSIPAIPAVREALAGTDVAFGAQDLHWEDRGAFTGAVSGADLLTIGCTYVEVGHAERRRVFGESEDVIRAKVAAAFRNGLTPVLCVGERHEVDPASAVVECFSQLESALRGLDLDADRDELVLAYEPEWAIGRQHAADPGHISGVVRGLRQRLHTMPSIPDLSIIYGGSAQLGTLTSLGGGVDGLFLGRFAHSPADFARIADEAAALA